MPACPKPEPKIKKTRFGNSSKLSKTSVSKSKKEKTTKEKPSTTKKKCDTIWSLVVRKSQPLCLWCGKRAAIHAHHIFTRQCIPTRHVIRNGAALCGGCHMRAHQHSAAFTDFIREQLGPEVYINLKTLAYAPHEETNTDYQNRKQILISCAFERRIELPSNLTKEKHNVHEPQTQTCSNDPSGRTVPHQEETETVQKETTNEEGTLGFGIEDLLIGQRINGKLID